MEVLVLTLVWVTVLNLLYNTYMHTYTNEADNTYVRGLCRLQIAT